MIFARLKQFIEWVAHRLSSSIKWMSEEVDWHLGNRWSIYVCRCVQRNVRIANAPQSTFIQLVVSDACQTCKRVKSNMKNDGDGDGEYYYIEVNHISPLTAIVSTSRDRIKNA